MKVSKLGMAWYRESEYLALRKLFTDGDRLPEEYSEWLKLAEIGFKKFKDEGQNVVKAYIHLDTFPDWCKDQGIEINSKARMKYANEYAFKDDSL